MSRLRLLVLLSVLSIIGILTTQAVWLRNAYALRERQFRQSAFIALQDVADAVARLNRITPNRAPVTQLSADYFIVNTDAPIHPVTLETLIQRSLQQHHLLTDYEYGIYDCETDRMVYGAYVSTAAVSTVARTKHLPKFPRYTYYFGIRFPNEVSYVAGPMSGWLWSTVAVLLVVVFFGYTLGVVLRQRRLTEVQRDFINNMTHELQTPVATIRVAADVLQTDAIAGQPDRLRQYARILAEESRRLQGQINGVLQLARATHGRAAHGRAGRTSFALGRTTVDLHELLTAAADAFAPHVTLDLTAADARLSADRYHLEAVLNNLVDNALKYCRTAPRIVLHTRVEGDRLIWSVRDNGVGIAPEYQKTVFRQFFRIPTGQQPAVNGFGLGLYYVWQVARAHGWQLRLDSEPGRGSTFTFGTSERIKTRTSGPSAFHHPVFRSFTRLPIRS